MTRRHLWSGGDDRLHTVPNKNPDEGISGGAMTEHTALKPLTRLQKWVVAFSLASFGVGMTISFVVAPPLARKAGLSEIEVAGILTLSSLLFAFLTPVWGRIANRYGRKRIMVFALMAMGVTNALFIMTLGAALDGVIVGIQAFFALAGVRLAFGLFSSGLQPAAFATMTDATTPHDRAAGLGLLGASMSVGSILGPAGAAALARFGALVPLWGAAGFAILCGTIVAFALPADEITSAANRPKSLSMTDSRVRTFVIFMIVYFMAVACVQQTLSWLVEDRYSLGAQGSVQAAGTTFGVMAAAMVLVQTFYVSRFKPRPTFMLPIGLALVATGYGLAIMPAPFWAMCMAFSLTGAGSALIVPSMNALGTLAVEPHEQGGAAAVMSAAPPAGFVIGPLLGAGIYMIDHRLPLIVASTSIALMLVFVLTRMRQPRVA